jgi:hypothetical protein
MHAALLALVLSSPLSPGRLAVEVPPLRAVALFPAVVAQAPVTAADGLALQPELGPRRLARFLCIVGAPVLMMGVVAGLGTRLHFSTPQDPEGGTGDAPIRAFAASAIAAGVVLLGGGAGLYGLSYVSEGR